jgi:hypothetical protein
MSEGSLVGIAGQLGLCNIGSFVSFVRSGILREAKYGIWSGGLGLAPAMLCCEPDPRWGFRWVGVPSLKGRGSPASVKRRVGGRLTLGW